MAAQRRLIALAGVAALAAGAPAAQAAVVGTGPAGAVAMRFDGRVSEAGRYFTFHGHITAVRGMRTSAVFAGAARPSRARLTFVAVMELVGRSEVGLRRFHVQASGPLRIFLQNRPDTTPDDPISFTRGTLVATATARLRALFIPAGPTGVAVRSRVSGTLVIRSSRPFTINGVSYQLGTKGTRVRVGATGSGAVPDIYLPAAEVRISGRATVARR